MSRFGGSCRTKNLIALPAGTRAWLRFGRSIAGGAIGHPEKRLFPLPPRSELPLEFIRLDPWEASYLYLLATHATQGIVEIGRLRGGSTFMLACANARVPIWSIDVDPRDDELLLSLMKENDVGRNVELLVGDSQTEAFREIKAFDVLFVDGDHSYEGVSADLRAFVPRLAPGGHLLLHDSYGRTPSSKP